MRVQSHCRTSGATVLFMRLEDVEDCSCQKTMQMIADHSPHGARTFLAPHMGGSGNGSNFPGMMISPCLSQPIWPYTCNRHGM